MEILVCQTEKNSLGLCHYLPIVILVKRVFTMETTQGLEQKPIFKKKINEIFNILFAYHKLFRSRMGHLSILI